MKIKKFIYLFFCVMPLMAFPQWSNDPYQNTIINDSTGTQAVPLVVTNSGGESYISWYSNTEGGRYDVFLQKIESNGVKLWDPSGLLISNHQTMSWVTTYDMILDKDEDVILVTQDQRTGSSNVFAYKISPEGQLLWGNDGIQLSNTTGFDPSPKIALADNGDAVFMWAEEPADTLLNSQVFLKSVSPGGSILWETILADTTYDFMLPQILHTENNDFIVSWMTKSNLLDTIPGQENWMHAFAQKIDTGGQLLWQNKVQIDSGKIMSYLSLYTTPYLANDGNGGAYVLWQSFTPVDGGIPTSYLNRIYNDGSLWKPNGYNVSQLAGNHHSAASMVYFEALDRVMVCWQEYHLNTSEMIDCFGIYGQLFASDGQYLWNTNGQEIIPLNCTMDTSYLGINISKSTNDNAVIAYQKDYLSIVEPDTMLKSEFYAVSIDQNGEFVWDDPSIVPFSLSSSYKLHLTMGNLVENQWVLAWEDNIENPDDYSETGIYAQNLNVDGWIGPVGISTPVADKNKVIHLYPNPVTEDVHVKYKLKKSGFVQLDLYNASMQLVRHIFSGNQQQGYQTIHFNLAGLPGGLYFIQLHKNNSIVYKKLLKN